MGLRLPEPRGLVLPYKLKWEQLSPQQQLSFMSEDFKKSFFDRLSAPQVRALQFAWRGWAARPNQLPPAGDWTYWLFLAGRGNGKTRSGGEALREWITEGTAKAVTIVAPTSGDIRRNLINGDSGIIKIWPDDKKPLFEPSKSQITFFNGVIAELISADEPDRLRGLNNDTVWADEFAAWTKQQEAWDMIMYGLRKSDRPRIIITTTPRPQELLIKLHDEAIAGSRKIALTTGTTYENFSALSANYFDDYIDGVAGTRLGSQEVYGEILRKVEGALWTQDRLDINRVKADPITKRTTIPCTLRRIVIAIDPAASTKEDSDETGIIVAGLGEDGHGYVLADLSLERASPDKWARAAVKAYWSRGADAIVVETNNGGDAITHAILTVDKRVNVIPVKASRGKQTRAEPISALYEQGRVHHVGHFKELETQMCSWDPLRSKKSPDRMDALVWAVSALMFSGRQRRDLTNLNLF